MDLPRIFRSISVGNASPADLAILAAELESDPRNVIEAFGRFPFATQLNVLEQFFGEYLAIGYLFFASLLAHPEALHELSSRVMLLQQARDMFAARADRFEALHSALRADQTKAREQKDALAQSLAGALQTVAEADKQRAELARLQSEWAVRSADLEAARTLDTEIAQLRAELSRLSDTRLAERQATLQALRKEASERRTESDRLTQQEAAARQALDQVRGEAERKAEQVKALHAEHARLSEQQQRAELEVSRLEQSLRNAREELPRLQTRQAEIDRFYASISGEVAAAREQLEKLSPNLDRLRTKYGASLKNLPATLPDGLRHQIDQVTKLLQETGAESLESTLKSLTSQLHDLSKDAVKALMQTTSSGHRRSK